MPIHTVPHQTAQAFLDGLRLSAPGWEMSVVDNRDWPNRESWAFRGQRDSSWPLLPSALRPTVTVGFRGTSPKGPFSNPTDQFDEERKAIVNFLFMADRVGLQVPGDGQHFRVPQLPGHPMRVSMMNWPWQDALDTMAMAQHHGVPTRLLDFTFRPFIAAFFAAYEAWKQLGRPSLRDTIASESEIAVYGVCLRNIFTHVARVGSPGFAPTPRLLVVGAPRASNSFLHHQDGLFLLDLKARTPPCPPLDSAYDDVLGDLTSVGAATFATHPFQKLTLPFSEVPALLDLLFREFINIASIQPTADNVVVALRDNQALNR